MLLTLSKTELNVIYIVRKIGTYCSYLYIFLHCHMCDMYEMSSASTVWLPYRHVRSVYEQMCWHQLISELVFGQVVYDLLGLLEQPYLRMNFADDVVRLLLDIVKETKSQVSPKSVTTASSKLLFTFFGEVFFCS